VAQLEATPDDTLIKERERLETQINDLDRKKCLSGCCL
jgi:hypothetical protein